MTNKVCFDTSIWIAYFNASLPLDFLENKAIVTSTTAIAELTYIALRERKDSSAIINTVLTHAKIVELSLDIAKEAGLIKAKERPKNKKFGLSDAIQLATARSENAILLTTDNDFKGIEDVQIVKV